MREIMYGKVPVSAGREMTCVAPTADWCGEGATWHADEKAVFWIDNRRNLIHRYSPDQASTRTWVFDEAVVALALTHHPGTLCVVLGSRLLLWSPTTDERQEYGGRLDGWPRVRFNEAGVGPDGDLWIGSMGNNVGPDGERLEIVARQGCLFRLAPDGGLMSLVQGIGVVNTIAWSPDGTRLYSADTLENEVRVYPYDRDTGNVGDPKSFLKGFPRGRPDGSAVDIEGSLWNCRYGGGCMVRVSAGGEVQEIVEVPVLNVTSCAFGGAALDTLYITTAQGAEPRRGRFDGGLFAMRVSVPGRSLQLHQSYQ